MLLMVETGIREGICHVIHEHVKTITNIWKIMIKVKKYHI